MKRLTLGMLMVNVFVVILGTPASAWAQKRLRIPFEYQGAGSEDQPVRYIMVRRGTERRTASNVLINAVNSMRLSLLGAGTTLQPGRTYESDYRQLSDQDVRVHNQNNPTKTLPGGVIYGVKYQVSYSIEPEQFSIDVAAVLGKKGAGPHPYRKYDGSYAGEMFTVDLSKAIENIFASAIFDRGDIIDGRALARMIVQHRDPVSNYIWSKAGDSRAALQAAAGTADWSEENWSVLVNLLNHVVYDAGFYDPGRFAGLRAGSALESLIRRRDAFDLPLLNRSLLQAWYPDKIAASTRFRQLFRVGE